MNKIVWVLLILSVSVFAEGFTFEPNNRITTSGWHNGKYETKTTTIDSTGKQATTSGWHNGKYETDVTTINSSGTEMTTSGWHNGKYVTSHSTIQK